MFQDAWNETFQGLPAHQAGSDKRTPVTHFSELSPFFLSMDMRILLQTRLNIVSSKLADIAASLSAAPAMRRQH